jgi:3-oxoacyl-[acyl-carrier-protein] synthase II
MRRVVVTGVGAITPLANGAQLTWEKLISSQSGISSINAFDVSDLSAKIAGSVPLQPSDASLQPGLFNASDYLEPKEQRKIDRFILYAIAAADEAVKDSGWKPTDSEGKERTGVTIGSGIGGLPWIYDTSVTLLQQGARRVSPFFIPASLINLASGQVSIRHGFQGPNHAVVTACATGAHSIGDAARMIMLDDADVMVAGGAEAAVCRAGMAGFAASRTLSTAFNDNPTKASRPWDRNRDGFVMGEGSGIVVLEEYEHAKKRGAKIYAEVLGYGMSGDAHHITSPAEDGGGAAGGGNGGIFGGGDGAA